MTSRSRHNRSWSSLNDAWSGLARLRLMTSSVSISWAKTSLPMGMRKLRGRKTPVSQNQFGIGDTPKISFLILYQCVTLCPQQNCRTAVGPISFRQHHLRFFHCDVHNRESSRQNEPSLPRAASCLKTIRTARSRTSGENRFVVLLMMALPSGNPGAVHSLAYRRPATKSSACHRRSCRNSIRVEPLVRI